MDEGQPFRRNRLLQGLVAWLLLFWWVTALAPYNRFDWLLENLLVFICGATLVATYRTFAFSNRSYLLLTLFLTLHLIGAHYTYAETPFGFWLQAWFGFSRNHYDRIVHFAFGLLIAYPMRELLQRLARVRIGWSYFLAVTVVLAFSGLYEIVEAWVAMIVSPELGAAYLGTQGDVWDAQSDMGAALLGAAAAMIFTWLAARRKGL